MYLNPNFKDLLFKTERICRVHISTLCLVMLSIYFLANSITVTKIICNKTTSSIIGTIVSQVWLLPILEHKYNNRKSFILKNSTTDGVAAADPAAVTQMNSLFEV